MNTTQRMVYATGAALACLLAGCATPSVPLYSWETFSRLQYETLLREGGSPLTQIDAMNAHAAKAKSMNAALPPGFRAHLGMLHLSVGNADAARDHWLAEKAVFPESATYIDSLLQKLSNSPKAVEKGNPA